MRNDAISSEAQAATAQASLVAENQNSLQTDDTYSIMNIQDKIPDHLIVESDLVALEKEKVFIKNKAEQLSSMTGLLIDSAIEVIKLRMKKILDDRDILIFADDPSVFIPIEQLLNSKKKYDRQYFIDPLTSKFFYRKEEYIDSKEKCIFKWNESNPIIIGHFINPEDKGLFEFDRINKNEESKKFRFLNTNELICNHVDWLIQGYIESEKMALFFGAPASFKSFVVIDMGLSIATGVDWHGHRASLGSVLYICGEGQSGIKARITAWEQHHNRSADNFFVSSSPVQILSEDSLSEIEAAADKISDTGQDPKLIIIDTLNRNFGDGDENSTTDMTKFVKGIDRLSQRLKCAIIIVHHSGLGDANRRRGSSALLGAVDFEYSCRVNGSPGNKLITLAPTKTKDHSYPETKVFEPLDIQIGIDCEGNPISSVVLVETSIPSQCNPLSNAQRIAFDALKTVIINGDPSEGAWKAEAYAQNISSSANTESKWKAFDRAKKQLLDQGLIDLTAGKYSIID